MGALQTLIIQRNKTKRARSRQRTERREARQKGKTTRKQVKQEAKTERTGIRQGSRTQRQGVRQQGMTQRTGARMEGLGEVAQAAGAAASAILGPPPAAPATDYTIPILGGAAVLGLALVLSTSKAPTGATMKR